MASQMRPIDPHLGFVGTYKESAGLVGAHPKKLLLLAAAFILPLVFVNTAVNQALTGTLNAEQRFWTATHPAANGSKVTFAESAAEIAFTYFGGPFSSWPRYFLRPVFGETEATAEVEQEQPEQPDEGGPGDGQVQHAGVLHLERRVVAEADYDTGDGDYSSDGGESAGSPPPPSPDADPDADGTSPPLAPEDAPPTGVEPSTGGPAGAPEPDVFSPGPNDPPFPPEDPESPPAPPLDADPAVSPFPPSTDLLAPSEEPPEEPPAAPQDPNPSPQPEPQADPEPEPGAEPDPDDADADADGAVDPDADPFAPPAPDAAPPATDTGEDGHDGADTGTTESASAGSSKLGLIIFLYICSFSLLITLSVVSVVAITSAVAGIYGTKYGVGHIWQPMDFYFGDILRSIPETALRVFGTGAITMAIFFGSLAAILQVFRASSIELRVFLLFLYAVGVVYVTTIWSLALPVVVLEKPPSWGFKPLIRSFHLLTTAKRVWLALGVNLSLFYGGAFVNFLTALLARALTGANSGFGWSFLYVLLVSLVMTAVIFVTLLVHTVFYCVCRARCDTDKDGLHNVKYVALSEKNSGLLEEGALKPKETKGGYEDELDDL